MWRSMEDVRAARELMEKRKKFRQNKVGLSISISIMVFEQGRNQYQHLYYSFWYQQILLGQRVSWSLWRWIMRRFNRKQGRTKEILNREAKKIYKQIFMKYRKTSMGGQLILIKTSNYSSNICVLEEKRSNSEIEKQLIKKVESLVQHLDHFWKFRDMISTSGTLPSDALCTKCVPKPKSCNHQKPGLSFFSFFNLLVPQENLTTRAGLATFLYNL